MTEKSVLQNVFLKLLCDKHIPVSIFLKSGIQLKGNISQFDLQVLMLEGNETVQMVYRHAISTVLPSQKIELPDTELVEA